MNRYMLIEAIIAKGPKTEDVKNILKRLSDAGLIGVAQELGIDTDAMFEVHS